MEETKKPEVVADTETSTLAVPANIVHPSKVEGGQGLRASVRFVAQRPGCATPVSSTAGRKADFFKGVNPLESTSADAEPIRELANYEQLVARAVDVFGDEIKASKWLSLPNPELNGETPLQVAQRYSYNGQVLEPIFTRIEHGIYF